jgi:predicted phage baseplate assembly protein
MTPTDSVLRNLDDCGCCEGVSAETPRTIENRPGLDSIVYRAGTHAEFKESLLAALAASERPALRGLATRSDSDFSIALLDAFAVMADVLTFYQERIANENYLRTAVERLSILELARLIGYELRPGVAASALLAFTLEEASGAFGQGLGLTSTALSGKAPAQTAPTITIPIGVKVQSVPGPGEQTQTFETIEAAAARPEWNAMAPRLFQPQALSTSANSLLLEGSGNSLSRGDKLLIADGANPAVVKTVVSVAVDKDANTTRVTLATAVATSPSFSASVSAAVNLGPKFSFSTPLSNAVVSAFSTIDLDQQLLQATAITHGWSKDQLFAALNVQAKIQAQPPGAGISVFRKRAGVFGNNAPDFRVLPDEAKAGIPDPNDRTLEDDAEASNNTRAIYLDTTYTTIVPGSFVALTSPGQTAQIYAVRENQETSRADYAISAKVTKVIVDAPQAFPSGFTLRGTTVLAQNEPLTLAQLPITDDIQGDTIPLDRAIQDLQEGETVIDSGDLTYLPGSLTSDAEAIRQVVLQSGFTTLVLERPLVYAYVRSTVTINSNVALSTHGESGQEVLGSGDATQVFQRFTLKQPPLTYVSAQNETGAASTLQVRVNDILWKEVPDLFGHGPEERIYVARQEDSGSTTVIFGDGITGARLPSGQQNIIASYRKGIGLPGLVKADQLSQIPNRPLGVKGVTNPLPANGAEDPEKLEQARRNAPLQILTLGRVVSLQDYEDFARAFSGIGKALATFTWTGQNRSVFLTIAGINGAAIATTDDLYTNLVNALSAAGDPGVIFAVQPYKPALFRVSGTVTTDPAFLPEKILSAVDVALRSGFSFDAREFGQPVALSEVVAVIQGVPGVVAVDIDQLYRSDSEPELNALVPASLPRAGSANAEPAELLTLDPAPTGLIRAPGGPA